MKAQYQHNKISVALAVRPNTTGDTIAIQKTIDNCAAKTIYLNTIDLDGEETQVVSVETSKGSNTYVHIALDTYLLTSITRMYPRDAVIGGRIPVDGTMLNCVVDSRAAKIRTILDGVADKQSTVQTMQVKPLSSDELLKQAVLQAIEERLSDIKAYYLTCVDDLLSNPASWLANYSSKLDIVGMVSLESYQAPFDLPIERINSLIQSEKYAAQLEQFKDDLVCNKVSNFRVHEQYLVCDGQPTEEQKTLLTSKGYVLVAKDTTDLQSKITAAMTAQDFASVVTLSQELVVLQSTVEIRKALAE